MPFLNSCIACDSQEDKAQKAGTVLLTSSCSPGVNENVRDCLPFNAANSLKDLLMLVATNLEVCLVTRVNKGTLKCLHVSCTFLRMRSMPSVLNILSCVKSLPEMSAEPNRC